MIKVKGRPFLEIILDNLKERGFTRIILSVCYKHEIIIDYFGSSFKGVELVYSIEEEPLGTGGAIVKSTEFISYDSIWVMNGDTFIDLDYLNVQKEFNKDKVPIMIVAKVANSSRYGKITTSKGKVKKFLHDGNATSSNLINAGTYLIPRDLFGDKKIKKSFSFEKEFLASYTNQNDLKFIESNSFFIDIGIPEDLEKARNSNWFKIPD